LGGNTKDAKILWVITVNKQKKKERSFGERSVKCVSEDSCGLFPRERVL